jgi:hypothetical protein
MFDFDEPIAITIFCDDVRSEIGGKFSHIGIYSGGMQVPAFPAVLPKFAFIVNVTEPREMAEARDQPIQIYIYLPGEDNPIISGNFGSIKDDLNRFPVPYMQEDPGANPIVTESAIFVVAPLVIQRPGRIRVRCEYPGLGLMRAGSLGVELQSQAAEATLPTAPLPPSEQSLLASPEPSSPPEPSRPARRVRLRRS